MALDPRQVENQFPGEGLDPRIAAEFSEPRQLRRLERQALRLLVGDHLQPVLHAAQEDIGPAQVLDRFGGHPLVGMELAQHVERARSTHLRPPAAENELLGLDEELDLTDAAAAELHVMAGNDDAVVPADRMDLALHRMDVGDGCVVEVLAPDKGRSSSRKRRPSSRSPAAGRALISAARSQFWPSVS